MIGTFLQVDLVFEPAFAFPGEKFVVVAPSGAEVSSDDVPLKRLGNKWTGIAPIEPPAIWVTLGPAEAVVDAARKILPIASGPLITLRDTEFSIVALRGSAYGAILRGKRFADLIAFDLAPRSAPLRHREFRVDYVYSSPERITISGMPGGLLRATVTVSSTGIDVDYSTLFDLSGTLRILDKEFTIPQQPPASIRRVNYLFSIPEIPAFRAFSQPFARSPEGVPGPKATASAN
ncbi:MAG: hypothetical protein M3R13_06040 [Armatimonadota bacterium]|nr:hypothetical protein [Armatimonadota bacterium]